MRRHAREALLRLLYLQQLIGLVADLSRDEALAERIVQANLAGGGRQRRVGHLVAEGLGAVVVLVAD